MRHRPPSRSASALLASVAVTLVISACGASQESQVRAKVMQFGTAAHDHDYGTICHQVLSPALLGDIASGGVSCEKAMSLALGAVRNARLVIGTITVSGRKASVQTLTQAKGERTALATLVLDETSTGWRVASLGNAAKG